LGKLFHNLLLSLLWGFAVFFATLKDRDTETSALAGLLAFATTLSVLWLLVDKEFSEENAVLINTMSTLPKTTLANSPPKLSMASLCGQASGLSSTRQPSMASRLGIWHQPRIYSQNKKLSLQCNWSKCVKQQSFVWYF
jgi:hypothetical protein